MECMYLLRMYLCTYACLQYDMKFPHKPSIVCELIYFMEFSIGSSVT